MSPEELQPPSGAAGDGEMLSRQVLNTLSDPIHVVDRELTFRLLNDTFQQWCRTISLEPPKIADTLHEAFPFLRHEIRDEYERVFSTGRALVTQETNTVEGRMIITETQKIPLSADGQVHSVITVVRDVTDRVRAERALLESEERLRAILSSIHEAGIGVYDYDGRLLTAWLGPGMEARYGMSIADATGRLLQDIYPPPLGKQRTAQIQEVFRTGKSVHNDCVARLPGGDFHLECTLSPMLGASGEVVAVVTFFRDVTESRRAAETLRRVRGKLVNAQEMERRRLAQELHDSLGQAMVAVHYRIEAIRADARSAGADAIADKLDDLAVQCNELIAQVRDISHGLFPPTLEQLGLPAALRKLRSDCEPVGIETNIRTAEEIESLRFPEEVEIALFRIAQEAVHNAVRHAACHRVDIELTRSPTHLCLNVVDDGKGFDPAGAHGKGLGLTNMRQRADAIAAELVVTSRPGKTRIGVRVPTQPLPGKPEDPHEANTP